MTTPDVPFPGLTTDSSRYVICKAIPSLYWFNQHKAYFHSKRWKAQYNAITSFQRDRGYPRGNLDIAYQHYRARFLYNDRDEGVLDPDERPIVKRQRRGRVAEENEAPSVLSSTSASPCLTQSAHLLPHLC
jgi:hypothetical protein